MIQEMNDPSLPTKNVELKVLAKVSQKHHAYYQQERQRQQRHKQNSYDNENENEIWLQMVQRGKSTSFKDEVLCQDKNNNNNNNKDNDDDCIVVDYEADIESFSSEEIIPSRERSWQYQTCIEFGSYQTCQEDCPFASHYHQVDMDLEICTRAFNVTNSTEVYENIQASLDHYGGKESFVNTDGSAGISNILTINGIWIPGRSWVSKDRISPVISYRFRSWREPVIFFLTHPVKDTDSLEVIQIREYLCSVVMGWLDIDSTDSDSMISSSATTTTTTANMNDNNEIVPIKNDEIVKLRSRSTVAAN